MYQQKKNKKTSCLSHELSPGTTHAHGFPDRQSKSGTLSSPCSANVATRQTSSVEQNLRFCNDHGGKTYTYKQTFRLDCTRSTGNYTLRLEIKHLLASLFLWVDDNKLLPHGSPRRCQRTSNETAALAKLTQAGAPLHSQWLATSTIGFDDENIIHLDKHQSQVFLKDKVNLEVSSSSFKSFLKSQTWAPSH